MSNRDSLTPTLRQGSRVRFPHDYADPEKLSGPVQTYQLRPEATAEERASWPRDIQKLWQKKFGGVGL